ncbi:MAG: thymidylate kinase [bacterium]
MFIVIDGIDGTGKETQTKLLVEKLTAAGLPIKMFDFPQYGQKSAALVEMYLNGEFGSAGEISPYQASVFYVCDRLAAKKEMIAWLNEGKIIVSNRYVSSSQIHQAGKIKDEAAKEKFLTWLDNLEFELFGVPKPDLIFYLSLPPQMAQELVDKKGAREYINGQRKRDIHEADTEHLQNAWQNGLGLAKKFDWQVIDCYDQGQILSREAIAEKIWSIVAPKLNLNP